MRYIDESKLKKEIGKLVCARRKALNLSQEKFAEEIGIKARTLSKIENGHTFISARTLCEMCRMFNITPKSFFDIGNKSTKSNIKINEIIEKLNSFSNEQIDLYYELLNYINKKCS